MKNNDENNTTEHAEEVPVKKKRKRLKHICSQIREQMEFYFGDSNLNKDRFLKQEMDADEDKYVPLDIFLNFNQIKSLTNDVKLIAKALSTSELLAVSSDGRKVKRVTPVVTRDDVDERTVYVERLPLHVDHEWVKSQFIKYGKVLYVSLPKYKSTGDIKGFAFVEFDSVDDAVRACQSFGGDATIPEHTDKFPKYLKVNKQIKQLQKQVLLHEPDETEVPQTEVKKGRKRPGAGSGDSSADEGETPAKRLREETPEDAKHDAAADDADKENTEDDADEKLQTSTSEATTTVVEQVSDREESQDTAAIQKADKRKLTGDATTDSRESKRVRINEDVQVKVTERQKQKRRRRRHRSSSISESGKDVPQLRVIPKLEWLKLKSEYLSLQKKSMHKLKSSLENIARRSRSQADNQSKKDGKGEGAEKELTFMPNVIVKVDTEKPTSRKDLKERLAGAGDIAYLDLPEGECRGHIRCSSADVANRIIVANVRGHTFSVLQGDEERKYWSKILADRQKKRSSKQRTKKRGSEKITEKVEKHNSDAAKRTHIVFDD